MLCVLHSRSECFGEQQKLTDCPVCSLVAVQGCNVNEHSCWNLAKSHFGSQSSEFSVNYGVGNKQLPNSEDKEDEYQDVVAAHSHILPCSYELTHV
jgi:hypothetical protein